MEIEQKPKQDPKKIAKGCVIVFILGIILIFAFKSGCSSSKPERVGSYDMQSLPDNFKYTVLEDKSDSYAKKNQLTIEISQKLTIGQIATLANDIYKTKPEMKRFFISYVLPGYQLGSGYWANSNFNPNLEITIMGSTPAEDALRDNAARKFNTDVLGKWKDDQLTNTVLILFKKDDKFFMKKVNGSGESHDDEMILDSSGINDLYKYKDDVSAGEYFVINYEGNLMFYNSENKNFFTANKFQ